MKCVSRRDFLKGAVASAAGIAAAGLLGGCSNESSVSCEPCEPCEPESTDWLGKAPEIKDSEIVKTIEADVVVVGAGNGGYLPQKQLIH